MSKSKNKNSNRGSFVRSLTPEQRSELARSGGKALAAKRGPAYFSEMGKKGGAVTSSDREWMAHIGRRGGKANLGSTWGAQRREPNPEFQGPSEPTPLIQGGPGEPEPEDSGAQ